ncbi:hypothetical protein MTX78_07125 [Hymenobacter tibetensis]|uniref:Uncharacterized protein n=1 Tax=Hymenobacter tibetensis TaxID=497967 RepID=A0ABY4D5B9_9BACT|nr:hypothetical protein [Hymenobacter tibetensis]UOG76364.1 hypothetical protein MTX78_07125 [Hymenobacter tibetensis]
MQTNPSSSDNTSDNADDFNNAPNKYPDNLERGVNDPNDHSHISNPSTSGTPQYGDFGHPESPTASNNQQPDRRAGANPDGQAAPSTVDPLQRGSVPQNLDPQAADLTKDDSYEDQREGWAKDDPRYGGGTRNWATNEPANHSTGAEPETADSERTNPNDGSNDNPDEFSALRKDGGLGIPGK